MKKNYVVLAAVLFSVVVGSAYAMDLRDLGRMKSGGENHVLQSLINLELSDVQRREIALTLAQNKPERELFRQEMRQAMMTLRDVSNADVFDEVAVRNACKDVAAVSEEVAVSRAMLVAALKDILNDEQLNSLSEQRQRRERRTQGEGHNRKRTLAEDWIEMYSK